MFSIHDTDIPVIRPKGHPECENCGSATYAANFVFKRVSGDRWMQVRGVRIDCRGVDPTDGSATVTACVIFQRGKGPSFGCEMDCPAMQNHSPAPMVRTQP